MQTHSLDTVRNSRGNRCNATSQPSRTSFAICHLCVGNKRLHSDSCRAKQGESGKSQKRVRFLELIETLGFSGPVKIISLLCWTFLLLHLGGILSVKWLSYRTVMVSCAVFILGPLWIHILTQACGGEELCQEAVLSWFRERVLDGLGLEEPPAATVQGPDGGMAQPEARHAPWRSPRTSRTAWVNHRTSPKEETSQIILFPSSGEKLCCFYLKNTS